MLFRVPLLKSEVDQVTFKDDLLFSHRRVAFAPCLAKYHLLATSNVQR